MRRLFLFFCALILAASLQGDRAVAASAQAASREASFTDPGVSVSGNAASAEAIIVEPKSEIDTGETFVNVAKRVTIFFINQSSSPVAVSNMSTTNDGNVKADIVSDDCSAGTRSIGSGSRCAVAVEITPTSAGSWTAEVLMTHNGSGRIARVKLSGKTSGKSASDKKDTGLSLSTKEAKPIDFGDVVSNQSKVARSALMVNDSPETITLMSIDVIAADNGLERLDQGCSVDMELKPGESCPVTLVWKPVSKGIVSTDLIIRHSGQLGFAVIPIRGTAKTDAKEEEEKVKLAKEEKAEKSGKGSGTTGKDDARRKGDADKMPMPTTADELERLTSGKIPQLSGSSLGGGSVGGEDEEEGALRTTKASSAGAKLRLIGTVGNRALILKPDGATAVVGIGEEVVLGEGRVLKVTNILPKMVEIFMDGKKKTLQLEAAQELISKASKASEKASDKGNAKATPVKESRK